MEIFFDELYDLIKKSRKAKLVEVAEWLGISTAHDKIGLQRAIRNELGEQYKSEYDHDIELNNTIYNILTK